MSCMLFIILFFLGAYASVPRSIKYDTTVGPDGPWNALTQTVSWPEQNITLLPSLTKNNLFVHTDACSDPRSACPQSQTDLWAGSVGPWSWMNSTPFTASTLDTSLTPLNLSGQASYISDRITLESPGQHDSYLDFTANAIDQSINVNYPSPNVWYTLDTGYLPQETCAAITEHLPVDFNETLGLYMWNTSAPSYHDIMTSPSYLSFNFISETSTKPLVNSPTQYFPCSPYQSPDGRFHLGRAFLQGAFMAQNWQTGQLMLAQAPGPDMADSSLVTISANGTSSVLPMIKAPSWDLTWASKLTAFQRNGSNFSEHTNGVAYKDLSPGSTAGIAVGVIVAVMFIAGVCWAWSRQQRTKVAQNDNEKIPPGLVEVYETGYVASSSLPAEVWAPGKHGLTLDPIELDAAAINELHGTSLEGGKRR